MRNANVLMFTAALLAAAADAAEPPKAQGTLIEITADASRQAPNDLARATAFVEATDGNPGELAQRVNNVLAAALKTAKAQPTVQTRSGSTYTQPNYAKNGRIDGWRMRAEILMETRDMTALSALLGKLQATLGVSQIALSPAPETRRKAEDDATIDALAAFQAKAKLVAGALGKPYRIRQMSIQSGGRPPIVPIMRGAMMAEAAAAPAPIEAGESAVTVTISGQIELAGDERAEGGVRRE
jgi:predicted secreted protein